MINYLNHSISEFPIIFCAETGMTRVWTFLTVRVVNQLVMATFPVGPLKAAAGIRRSVFFRVHQVAEPWPENARYRNPLPRSLFPVCRRPPVDRRDDRLQDPGQ